MLLLLLLGLLGLLLLISGIGIGSAKLYTY